MNYNNWIVNGIHATRYVASWVNAGGKVTGIPRYDQKFMNWLKQLIINGRSLTEKELSDIYEVAQMLHNGKLELQENAKEFLKGA